MKKTDIGYQHGDVIIRRIATMPEGGRPVAPDPRGIVLAEGELTGHAHVITETTGIEAIERDGVLYLRVHEGHAVHHEEHDAGLIGPGTYQIDRVRERDPFSTMVRPVRD